MNIPLSPYVPKSLVSRDGFRLNLVLTRGIPPRFRGGVHFFMLTAIRHRVSPEFIGSRNCMNQSMDVRLSFPTPTIGMKWAYIDKRQTAVLLCTRYITNRPDSSRKKFHRNIWR